MLNKVLRVTFLVSILMMVALAGFGLVLSAYAAPVMSHGSGHCQDLYEGCWTFGWDFTFGTFLSVINTGLAAILLGTYISIYMKTGTPFNLILILVAVTFLCYSLVANPLFSAILGYEGLGLGPFFILPHIFALAALSALLYLSLKY